MLQCSAKSIRHVLRILVKAIHDDESLTILPMKIVLNFVLLLSFVDNLVLLDKCIKFLIFDTAIVRPVFRRKIVTCA
jgi:hypothetical protein